MLKAAADYPHPGSYALHIASDRAELVRVVERHGADALVAYPLRTGAQGNARIPAAAMIDATPLTAAEVAELESLRDHLQQQVRPNRRKVERAEALRTRQIYSEVMRFERAKLDRLTNRREPSIGSLLPRDADAPVGLDGHRTRTAA